MHAITLPSPEAVAAVVAALGVSGTICSQASDGTWHLSVPDASAAQADALAANPPATLGLARLATTYQLMSALTDTQWTAYSGVKATDQRLFSARDTPWPENNGKVGRIATVVGTTPKAWFDAALGAGA